MPRQKQPLTAKQELFIRMEARGEDHYDILREVFGIPADADKKTRHNAEACMSRWRQLPEFRPIWEDEVATRVRQRLPRAIGRIDKQIDDENGWLANKAANDYITAAKTLGILGADESKSIQVQITGMPDLGSPDQDG